MASKIGWTLAGVVAVLTLTYAALSMLSKPIKDHPFFVRDEMLVIAHQGGDGLRPGNTISAFAHAVELGVDVLEMDVHSTADDVLVLMHDETVDRTTNGSGRIQSLTLAELKKLDAGHHWSEDAGQSYPYRNMGISVPTLEEIVIAFPEMRMNIEIKQESPSIVEPLCQLLHRYHLLNRVLVASFHRETINEFRDQCPQVATSMVKAEIRTLFALNMVFLGNIFQAPSEAIQVPEYSDNLHVVTRRFVDAAHHHNLDLHVWTVNEEKDMERMLELGVGGLLTDRPDRLLALLGRL